jgi:hypothetical protein
VLLDQHATMTLTYAVSCRQHRVTPPLDHLAVDAALWHCPPDGLLDALVRGRVVRPGDQEWDTARAAWNLAVDQRPDLVVEVADPFDGAIDAPADEAERLLAPLRRLGPMMDSFAVMPTSELGHIHLDPPHPVAGIGDGISLVDLTPDVIAPLVAHAGPEVDSALLAVDIQRLCTTRSPRS